MSGLGNNPSDRYGTPSRASQLAVGVLVAGLIGILGAVLWAAWNHSQPTASPRLVAYTVVSEREVVVRYEITRADPSIPVSCTLAAQDAELAVVGVFEDQIPASTSSPTPRVVRVPTRQAAALVVIEQCSTANR
jgi:hypothetical protein